MITRPQLLRMKISVARNIGQFLCAGLIGVPFAGPVQAQSATLVGASQFDENHPVTRTLHEFERLVTECYSGEVEFRLHANAALGFERDYFEFMSQGITIDYAVVSPGSMSSILPKAALLDAPFLFGSDAHLDAALEENVLDQFANEILEQADVRIIGYAGGSTRNVFANTPVRNMDELAGLSIRVPGVPIWAQVFDTLGASPTMIPYSEVYTALRAGVSEAAESEAVRIEQTRFYEVAPEVTLTQHAIAIRPLLIANTTYQNLDEELQNCIDEAGRAAGQFGRKLERSENSEELAKMEEMGWITVHDFAERATLFDLADPVLLDYADSLDAAELYWQITAACPDWCDTSCDDHDCHACRVCRN